MSSEEKRYETTVHDKRTGQPVRGCDGDAVAEVERLAESVQRGLDLSDRLRNERDEARAEVERLEQLARERRGDALWERTQQAESEVERLREALKNEIRWNIEGTGIHPDDQEEVIERHYQEALHPDEKREER